MKVSIIFLGLLEVVADMIIVVEPRAAIPREYDQIPLHRNIIERSHQPYDRYSNTKLFWPEERLSYTGRGKITYYKCINRAPSSTNALMHVIRGGTGILGLVADVGYAPARFMLVNSMIVTCDIYMGENDIATNKDTTPLVDVETAVKRTEGDLMTQKTMEPINSRKNLPEIEPMTITKTTRFYSEAESGETDEITARIKGTTVEPDREIQSIEETKKTLYTDRPSLETSSKDSENEEKDRISSSTEKTSWKSQMTTLTTTNPENVQTTLQERVTPPMIDETTSNMENDDSGTEETIEIMCQGTGLVTNKIDSHVSGISKNGKADEIQGLREDQTSLTTERATLEVTSPKSVESTSQKSTTSLDMEIASSSMEVEGATTETAFEIPCDEISLGTGEPNGQNSQGEESKNSTIEETVESGKQFPTYKLVLKIVSLGKKKRIGLAKITY